MPLLATAACLAHSGLRAPVPAVNEPHYMAKALHWVNPAWCDGDFFLESSNPHLVFYTLVGPLTAVWTFPAVAWLGRVLALTLLATGWVAIARRLVPDDWGGWTATAAFLLAAAIGNLSGEWIVGGFESKVLAYGLLAWSTAFGLDHRRRLAGILCGLAISFHPIVGGWGLVLAVLAHPWPIDRHRLEQAALVVVCALPGVIPALGLLGNGSAQADTLQVFARLGHHLVPARFSPTTVAIYLALAIAWLIARLKAKRTPGETWWMRLLLGSLVIAATGWALALNTPPDLAGDPDGWNRLRLVSMKFYPYRLFDVLLPAAMAISVSGLLARLPSPRLRVVVPAVMLAAAFSLPTPDRNPSRLSAELLDDWTRTCGWIDGHLPPSAIVLTPRGSWAFKWYARRAEFVVFKDCPQDAAGVLEWDRRRLARGRWLLDIQMGRPPLETTTGAFAPQAITHVLWRRADGPATLEGFETLFETSHHVVYAVPAPVSAPVSK